MLNSLFHCMCHFLGKVVRHIFSMLRAILHACHTQTHARRTRSRGVAVTKNADESPCQADGFVWSPARTSQTFCIRKRQNIDHKKLKAQNPKNKKNAKIYIYIYKYKKLFTKNAQTLPHGTQSKRNRKCPKLMQKQTPHRISGCMERGGGNRVHCTSNMQNRVKKWWKLSPVGRGGGIGKSTLVFSPCAAPVMRHLLDVVRKWRCPVTVSLCLSPALLFAKHDFHRFNDT